MLQLKNIYKSYIVGEEKQQVLKDINITFRKNEFVSILGASGSGKTTLLNIIGGLDVYDSGDLIIDNLSTKNFTKKGRTFLTSFAGSIGILGICLVLILNSGLKNTIDNYEKKSVASFPIVISQNDYDINNAFNLMIQERPKCEDDKICSYDDVVSSFNNNYGLYVKNDVKSFKEYIEKNKIGRAHV